MTLTDDIGRKSFELLFLFAAAAAATAAASLLLLLLLLLDSLLLLKQTRNQPRFRPAAAAARAPATPSVQTAAPG